MDSKVTMNSPDSVVHVIVYATAGRSHCLYHAVSLGMGM